MKISMPKCHTWVFFLQSFSPLSDAEEDKFHKGVVKDPVKSRKKFNIHS